MWIVMKSGDGGNLRIPISSLQLTYINGAIRDGKQFYHLYIADPAGGVIPRTINLSEIRFVEGRTVTDFEQDTSVIGQFRGDKATVFAPPFALTGTIDQVNGFWAVEDEAGVCTYIDLSAVNNIQLNPDLKRPVVDSIGSQRSAKALTIRTTRSSDILREIGPLVRFQERKLGNDQATPVDCALVVVISDMTERRALYADLVTSQLGGKKERDDLVYAEEPRIMREYGFGANHLYEIIEACPYGIGAKSLSVNDRKLSDRPLLVVLLEDEANFKIAEPTPGTRVVIIAKQWNPEVRGWRILREPR